MSGLLSEKQQLKTGIQHDFNASFDDSLCFCLLKRGLVFRMVLLYVTGP
jgi:hypothetical protein